MTDDLGKKVLRYSTSSTKWKLVDDILVINPKIMEKLEVMAEKHIALVEEEGPQDGCECHLCAEGRKSELETLYGDKP